MLVYADRSLQFLSTAFSSLTNGSCVVSVRHRMLQFSSRQDFLAQRSGFGKGKQRSHKGELSKSLRAAALPLTECYGHLPTCTESGLELSLQWQPSSAPKITVTGVRNPGAYSSEKKNDVETTLSRI